MYFDSVTDTGLKPERERTPPSSRRTHGRRKYKQMGPLEQHIRQNHPRDLPSSSSDSRSESPQPQTAVERGETRDRSARPRETRRQQEAQFLTATAQGVPRQPGADIGYEEQRAQAAEVERRRAAFLQFQADEAERQKAMEARIAARAAARAQEQEQMAAAAREHYYAEEQRKARERAQLAQRDAYRRR